MSRSRLQLFSEKTFITLTLLLVGSLHTMIFTFFQLPGNFTITTTGAYLPSLIFVSYASAILSSFFHQPFSRRWGIKKLLILGLALNFMGLFFILIRGHLGSADLDMIAVFAACISFGLALLTVINSLVTYLILEYPKQINTGLIVLFIFLNAGVMVSPILQDFFSYYQAKWVFIVGLMAALCIAAIVVIRSFANPSLPKHQEHLRKNSNLWKDLHYRLVFFVLALIFYGIVENTFSLWGEIYLTQFYTERMVNFIITLFWLFMIIGQLFALLPLYFFNTKVVFSSLCLVAMLALAGLYSTTDPTTMIGFIILGGIGCSALFPLLLSSLGNQLIKDSKSLHEGFLPYIEMGTAYLLAGYTFGIGFVNFWHTFVPQKQAAQNYFYYAIWCCLGVLLIYLFLDSYSKARNKIR